MATLDLNALRKLGFSKKQSQSLAGQFAGAAPTVPPATYQAGMTGSPSVPVSPGILMVTPWINFVCTGPTQVFDIDAFISLLQASTTGTGDINAMLIVDGSNKPATMKTLSFTGGWPSQVRGSWSPFWQLTGLAAGNRQITVGVQLSAGTAGLTLDPSSAVRIR